ncbi:MAG: hemin-degrading factor [Leptospira sp.]|nr:hemin-degrading factor [Leptospira sp.]
MVKELSELKQKWDDLKKDNPKLRIKDCADMLGVSELELLLTDLGEENPKITHLNAKPTEVMARAKELGYVMALSRNDHCVHERKGIYGDLSLTGPVGLFTGEDIDLRVFFASWKYSVAVEEKQEGDHPKRSLQFFDKWGKAVHKIHLNEKSNHEGFLKIVADMGSSVTEYESVEKKESTPSNGNQKSNDAISVDASFLKEWSELKDTHDFYGMLRKHNLSRTAALEVAEGKFTKKLPNDTIRNMLNTAAQKDAPIMVFLYNPGMVQIHTGPVKNIQILGPWLNVMDPEFNLHLREDKMDQVWWVDKPTEDGNVQSLEVFDAEGELVVQFFGKRKPGQPEREDWKSIMDGLKD